MKLSLIIPAYDEEKRILKTLIEYNNFLKKIFKNNFEIIIIPNNCKDNTLGVVENFAKKNKQIKFFNFPNYCGKPLITNAIQRRVLESRGKKPRLSIIRNNNP